MEKKYKVLIVEDEMLVRIGIQSLINWEEMNMVILGDAENGKKGLEYFRSPEEAPDIVFTDINMPIMDGLDMMQAVREMGYDRCIFIILTVLEEFDYARRALKLGAFDYIPKLNMTRDNLTEVLQKARERLENIGEPEMKAEKKKTENSLSLARLVQGYLQFHMYTVQEFSGFLEKYGISSDNGVFLCASAMMRDAGMRRAADEESVADVALLNTLNDIFGNVGKGCVYVDERNVYNFILFFDERSRDALLQKFHEAEGIIQMYFNCRMQIGFSRWGEDLGDLIFLLEESRCALETVSFWNLDEWLFYGEDIQEMLIRCCQKELHMLGEGEDGWQDEIDCRNVQNQKQMLIRLEYDIFQRIIRKRKIPFSAEEQVLLFANAGTGRTARQITETFRRELEGRIEKWEQELAENRELRKAVEFIKEHYPENITVDQIAGASGYSVSYLSRLMKEQNGRSLMDYLNWYRIEKAKEMIWKSGLKSYEVAEKVGISDPNYFSRIFKKYTGKSVKEYRKNPGGE